MHSIHALLLAPASGVCKRLVADQLFRRFRRSTSLIQQPHWVPRGQCAPHSIGSCCSCAPSVGLVCHLVSGVTVARDERRRRTKRKSSSCSGFVDEEADRLAVLGLGVTPRRPSTSPGANSHTLASADHPRTSRPAEKRQWTRGWGRRGQRRVTEASQSTCRAELQREQGASRETGSGDALDGVCRWRFRHARTAVRGARVSSASALVACS